MTASTWPCAGTMTSVSCRRPATVSPASSARSAASGRSPPARPSSRSASPSPCYKFGTTGGIIGMESTGLITGHGDISNEATWWLSYSLATAHLRD